MSIIKTFVGNTSSSYAGGGLSATEIGDLTGRRDRYRRMQVGYTEAAQSKATKRSYSEDVRHFKRHGGTIPASPAMVAEYLANFAESLAVATLQHRLIAIHRAHIDIGLPSPIIDIGLPSPIMDRRVKQTMQGNSEARQQVAVVRNK